MNYTKCRSCGALTFFAINPSGKLLPMDARPVDDGGYVLVADANRVRVRPYAETDVGALRYHTHFVTCPDRKQWRK